MNARLQVVQEPPALSDRLRRLTAANALLRKLRGWGLGVSQIDLGDGGERLPTLTLIRDAAVSIARLLDATEVHWRQSKEQTRAYALLDGCWIVWTEPQPSKGETA
jgi:hypothetical protein